MLPYNIERVAITANRVSKLLVISCVKIAERIMINTLKAAAFPVVDINPVTGVAAP